MIRFAPTTEEKVALAKSLTDPEIDELVEQISWNEHEGDLYWGIIYVRDLWALGIEPKIGPGRKIVARFGGDRDSIEDDWKCRKAGQYTPYFGEEAEIEEYRLANQNKEAEVQPGEGHYRIRISPSGVSTN